MRFRQFGPQVLKEYNRNITAQKLGAALLQKFRKEPKQWQERVTGAVTDYDDHALQYLLELVEKADPTKNKQYVPWIIRTYVNTPNMRFEDAITKVTEPLTKFYKLVQKKQIPAPNNDIGRIRDLAGLVQTVDQYPDVVDQPKDADRGSAEEVYRDAEVRVIKPNDEKASCYYGQGTRWCTAGRDNNMFDRYAKSGPLYIIIPKNPSHPGEKYQFHFEAKQFMDENDRQTDIPTLLDRFPQLRDLFRATAEKTGAFAFLYSPEQFDMIENDVKSQLYKQLAMYLRNTAATEAKKLARDVIRSDSLVRDIIDFEELYEMLETSLTHAGDLAKELAYQSNPNDWGNVDGMYDLIFNLTGNWMRKEEFWMYVEELDEIDPDVFQHAGMSLEGDLSTLVSGAIEKILPGIIKDATSRL